MRQSTFYAALLFCLLSFIIFSLKKEERKALMSGISILYVFLPLLTQKCFHFRLTGFLYLLVMAYTICPLLGYSYNLYHLTTWWDDMLHALSGVLFALFGAYLPTLFCKNENVCFPLRAFCAFSFSVAIAGLWELIEFTSDTFFLTDMQKDTLLQSMPPSYLLSEFLGLPLGELSDLYNVQVVINGLPIAECIDIGLIDSMQDILIETLGATLYTALYCAHKGKRFCLQKVNTEQKSTPSNVCFFIVIPL